VGAGSGGELCLGAWGAGGAMRRGTVGGRRVTAPGGRVWPGGGRLGWCAMPPRIVGGSKSGVLHT
jgi:hypothetical protein